MKISGLLVLITFFLTAEFFRGEMELFFPPMVLAWVTSGILLRFNRKEERSRIFERALALSLVQLDHKFSVAVQETYRTNLGIVGLVHRYREQTESFRARILRHCYPTVWDTELPISVLFLLFGISLVIHFLEPLRDLPLFLDLTFFSLLIGFFIPPVWFMRDKASFSERTDVCRNLLRNREGLWRYLLGGDIGSMPPLERGMESDIQWMLNDPSTELGSELRFVVRLVRQAFVTENRFPSGTNLLEREFFERLERGIHFEKVPKESKGALLANGF